MRFSFLAIVALTASMSVSACLEEGKKCKHNLKCCSGHCILGICITKHLDLSSRHSE
ncbi:hypothetical protein M405DRAFT_810141 [Rhizopogon salebrosus TDB-379]|nr:hypothetical protein M405DRAFT_810141 [Rhizopogon salebrosus TDB-379]